MTCRPRFVSFLGFGAYPSHRAVTRGGTGEILIDGLVWRVGYWGDRAELATMEPFCTQSTTAEYAPNRSPHK